MILFKDNNAFTEMNVLTATERAVQRREVIYNTTGIASVAQSEQLIQRELRVQRNPREAMEAVRQTPPPLIYEVQSFNMNPASGPISSHHVVQLLAARDILAAEQLADSA